VHDPVPALGPAALVACRDPAVRVPPGLVATLGDEGLLGRGAGELVEARHARAAPARRRRLVLANRHRLFPRLEDLDRVTLRARHDRSLLIAALAFGEPAPLDLAVSVERVDRRHPDVPDGLDGLLDLGLVRSLIHEERVGAPLQARVGLLGDYGTDNHVAGGLHERSPASASAAAAGDPAATPSRASSASVSAGRGGRRRSCWLMRWS